MQRFNIWLKFWSKLRICFILILLCPLASELKDLNWALCLDRPAVVASTHVKYNCPLSVKIKTSTHMMVWHPECIWGGAESTWVWDWSCVFSGNENCYDWNFKLSTKLFVKRQINYKQQLKLILNRIFGFNFGDSANKSRQQWWWTDCKNKLLKQKRKLSYQFKGVRFAQ